MSRVCQVTGKRPLSGNNVSHAHNKTRRRFLPNLHARRFWVESENRWVRLRVSTKGLRIIDKKGIDTVLKDLRTRGEKVCRLTPAGSPTSPLRQAAANRQRQLSG